MPFETLPTADELNRMDDLSGAALYRAEVRRIPFIPRAEQAGYIDAARHGDEQAQHHLILNCLNWAMRRAKATAYEAEPAHTDTMDLVGEANVKMLEAMPNALRANDPIAYLMSVSATEMRRYCAYRDPLVRRHKDQPLDAAHPATVSLEASGRPLLDILSAGETSADTERPAYRIVYNALAQLSKRHQVVLTAAYGLHGEMKQKNEDIAAMLNVSKETVEVYLWRAKRRLASKLAPYFSELVFG
jgi:RNA polymerase sigma factor (sigma-70 family)